MWSSIVNSFNKSRSLFQFLLITACVFLQLVLFHWFAFHSIILSSLWKNPWAFCGFYFPKIAASMVVGATIFLMKNRRWVFLILSLIDVWLLANMMYLRSYDMVIDAFSLSMIGNLSGFENSLSQYIHEVDAIYPIMTLCLIPLFRSPIKNDRFPVMFIYWLVMAYSISMVGQYGYNYTQSGGEHARSNACWELFSRNTRQTIYGMELTAPTKQTSILHTMIYDVVDVTSFACDKYHPYKLSDSELAVVSPLLNDSLTYFDEPLIIILVESFENWAYRPEVMPNLTRFVSNHKIFYADKVSSQVRGGMSADGQMIINTGLLPTLEGAACYRFPLNTYPGIMKQSIGRSIMLVPHEKDVWNQEYMSRAYDYDTTAVCSAVDTLLFPKVKEYLHNGYQNVQLITMSTHTPFKGGAALSDLKLPEQMPEMMANYLKAMHTLDAGLNRFLVDIDSDSILKRASIVITGDHKIFNDEQRSTFLSKVEEYAWDYDVHSAYCPLFIISPYLHDSVRYSEVAYQMDIYSTISDLMKIKTAWRGFGRSLLDITPQQISPINNNDALSLSDKLHRSNFFYNK